MVKIQIMMAALVGAINVIASPYNVSYSRNFATEKRNIDSDFYDLSDFGYFGGQLPKVYSLHESNSTGPIYLPEESYQEFQKIISGKNNASDEFIGQQRALSTMKRSTVGKISMLLRNAAGTGDTFAIEANKVCRTASNAPWHYVIIYSITEAYIAFWKSDVCNGHKGSFNPVCDWYDDPSEACVFNFKPKSFRAYSGCHHDDGWGEGCASHTL
ncbi:uncharacterized protein N7483_004278 [Penicillium malachiteum]|uniref:uncharacterized protein n=1 Tax=Penicillium malachiteum TaxID=1324776 RepID=UPI0025488910|nr:uncharacterized protein N7483_004278 [Penicillium malachiteum]KAJ5729770.1 hypothetical protein N7483_004278 [Penicillium malachiteum]